MDMHTDERACLPKTLDEKKKEKKESEARNTHTHTSQSDTKYFHTEKIKAPLSLY
jgi:hypothetical protein